MIVSMFLWLTVLAPAVTFSSLVDEATHLTTLTQYPSPAYVTKQASSYDRASTVEGVESWFANKDWGNYIRTEVNNGRTEYVLMDAKGPGVMVRYWTPNPTGVSRIYVDDNPTPVIEAKTADLLSGKVAPFLSPVAQETSKGWSFYCPVAYQKSLKVTIDNSENNAERMYYQVQYRTYTQPVELESFSKTAVDRVGLAQKMIATTETLRVDSERSINVQLAGRGKQQMSYEGSSVIKQMYVSLPSEPANDKWDDPTKWHNLLRSIRFRATFDDELCIDAPLGDFLSCQTGIWPLDTMPAFSHDGSIYFKLPMPFARSAKFEFENTSQSEHSFTVNFQKSDYSWNTHSMHLKAQWLNFKGSTRPMRDLSFLDCKGEGVFVGCNVSISNPTPDWWGEGDEKMFIDGEAFPSTFGTGTEDYFGYGWSNPALFTHPYHYQSHCDGPGTKGHSAIGRWQILDRLPFTKSFKFDMELWHWAEVDMQYGRTAFWYAKPGGSAPKSDDPRGASLPYIDSGIKRVKGVIEGESMMILAKTGGETEVQDFGGLSGGKQLWWRDGVVNSELRLGVPVADKGRYRVYLRACTAPDYGVHDIWFGTISRQIDFYGKLGWKTIDLGTTILDKSEGEPLRIWAKRSNPKAEPRLMFGVDYILLVKED